MQTKIRSTIIALVAAFSFAASMPVSTAQATPKDGRYPNSAEGRKQKADDCAFFLGAMEAWEKKFDDNIDAGNKPGAAYANTMADAYFNAAKKAGCGWAQ